ncbi:hypothetical protein [Providencia huaxiensis]|uniref:Lysozyme inhibitor LprI N-terminal domain-containing protein n=1 Tax=Providencia huaxiensis TaxID=2027290 RepID=A0ABU2J0Q5_9GAMM|nr:hypothetical protein [Providencia huaxiensis]MDI7238720.1 hypothetical protein [Providencia huaxiensis]MDT0134898.1 hypothetical protein [Providencia huaxiensis]MDT1981303.1 hypothetical protein [Providencia huaxiensis]
MKKILVHVMLPLLMTSSLAIAESTKEETYSELKPIASDIYHRSIALVELIPDSYQSYSYTDDKAVWRKAKDERNALSNEAKKLGNVLSSPFKHCIQLANFSGSLWGQSMSGDGKMDSSFFQMYTTAKKDCKYQLDNLPEDKSNLRAVDL